METFCLFTLRSMMNDSTGGKQIGGRHYKSMGIQPIDYAEANKMTPTEFSVVKYVTRHRHKDGWTDLEKAYHFLDMLALREYGVEVTMEYRILEKDKGGHV